MACLVLVFACLSLNHFYPSKTAYTLVGFASGMVVGVYVFKSLWSGLSNDWVGASVVILTALFTVVLPAVQLLLQSPSLYVSAGIFGVLLIGVLRDRLPGTFESQQEADH